MFVEQNRGTRLTGVALGLGLGLGLGLALGLALGLGLGLGLGGKVFVEQIEGRLV